MGDFVVADYGALYDRLVGPVVELDLDCCNRLYWRIGVAGVCWAFRVRRPTPEELAAYQLSRGGLG